MFALPSVGCFRLLAIGHAPSHTERVGTLEDFRTAASGLAHHPQDHGWRDLYRLFSHGLTHSAPNLTRTLLAEHGVRPAFSATHLLTLLGIALKVSAPGDFATITVDSPFDGRLRVLEEILNEHQVGISAIIQKRQNSFTSARRFIVPQVLLSAYFKQMPGYDAVFADFGTGLGILPRQLNSASQFDRFRSGLIWPKGVPAFHGIPIAARHGVDRGPMPDLGWVQACYGQSDYYHQLFGELVSSLEEPEVKEVEVVYTELDLLNYDALSSFIRRHEVNVANLTYVLYEFDRSKRAELIEFLVRELRPPGALIIAEPNQELHGQGTLVEFFHNGDPAPLTLCYVSDGHYKGYVIPLEDYAAFSLDYPIAYELVNSGAAR